MVLERARTQGKALRRMGLAFDGLTVKGRGSGVGQGRTLGSTLGALPLAIMAKLKGQGGTVTKTILQDLTGYVRPGQMLLVLGTPGSGCTSFLRTVSAYTEGFQAVEGQITYAGYDAKDVQHFLRGDVVYCAEDDV